MLKTACVSKIVGPKMQKKTTIFFYIFLLHYQSKMEKNCPIKLMMVIFRFSNAFEYRIYLGVDLMLYLGVGLAYMLYTEPEFHVIKNLFSNF